MRFINETHTNIEIPPLIEDSPKIDPLFRKLCYYADDKCVIESLTSKNKKKTNELILFSNIIWKATADQINFRMYLIIYMFVDIIRIIKDYVRTRFSPFKFPYYYLIIRIHVSVICDKSIWISCVFSKLKIRSRC